jgi:hypothetical protein
MQITNSLVKGMNFEGFCTNKLHEGFYIGSVVQQLIASTGRRPEDVTCLFLIDGIHNHNRS